MDGADADAHRMQAPGRDDETHAVEQRTLARREFGTVRMAVEDREASDDECRDDQRRPHLEGNCGSEHNGRRRYPVFDSRNWHAEESKHAAHRHDQRKRHRQHPDRRRAKLSTPQADGHHREHVVCTGQRVQQACQKSARFPLKAVPEG